MEMIKMATYEETKEALEGAIKKWELIYANAGADEGIYNCPLCELFNYDECIGCPVDYGGYYMCNGGPYADWHWHQRMYHASERSFKVQCNKCTEYALSMINYLKSLRPVVDEMFDKTDKRKV